MKWSFHLLRGTLFLGMLGIGVQAYTRSALAPTGRTGAPGQSTCAGCHTGTPVNGGGGSLSVSGIPASGYVPGTSYSVTVRVTDPAASRFGFSACLLNSRTQVSAGTLQVTSPTTSSVQNSNGIDYIGHINAGSSNSWTFTWVAPVAGTGTVNLFAVANAADNSRSAAGDHIYQTQLTFSESTTTAVADEQAQAAALLMVFPNPATDRLWLTGTALEQAKQITLLDALGRTVLTSPKASTELDVREMAAGRYTLRVTTADGQQIVRPVLLRK